VIMRPKQIMAKGPASAGQSCAQRSAPSCGLVSTISLTPQAILNMRSSAAGAPEFRTDRCRAPGLVGAATGPAGDEGHRLIGA